MECDPRDTGGTTEAYFTPPSEPNGERAGRGRNISPTPDRHVCEDRHEGEGAYEDGHADDFTTVTGRAGKKRAQKEQAALERLRKELANTSKGVFKVTLRRKPISSEVRPNFQFASGNLMSIFKELHQLFPNCSLTGGIDGVHVWAPTLTVAHDIMKVCKLGNIYVEASCDSLSSFKARIDNVSMVFTEEELLAELGSVGVTNVRKMPYTTVGGRTRQVGRVLLVFDRPPPPSVFLGYRVHAVTMEAAKPLICYNCQRLGHHSSSCRLPRACKRCGQQGHLASDCTNGFRCVNCKGAHLAGSSECPRVVFLSEKNRLMMEARVLQQVRESRPSAVIAAVAKDTASQRPDASLTVTPGTQLAPAKSYASVVRSIAVVEDGVPAPTVLLPKQRVLPIARRASRKPRPNGQLTRRYGKRPTARANTTEMKKPATGLSSLVGLLKDFNPQATKALRMLVSQLQPLLHLAQLLQGDRATKNRKQYGRR